MTHSDRITIDPDICNGKPVVRGRRITVEIILGYLSAGETPEEILRQQLCWSRRTFRRVSRSPAV